MAVGGGHGTPRPCLLIPSRGGHHVSKPSSRGSRSPGTRQMASGEWGRAGTKEPLRPRGGAGWASSSLGLSSTRQLLMPHREILEALGESCRFWGQAWAAGERGQGVGGARDTQFLTPAWGQATLEQVGQGTHLGPLRSQTLPGSRGLGLS